MNHPDRPTRHTINAVILLALLLISARHIWKVRHKQVEVVHYSQAVPR